MSHVLCVIQGFEVSESEEVITGEFICFSKLKQKREEATGNQIAISVLFGHADYYLQILLATI